MIDHVTIHVPPGTLDNVNLTDFFWMLGMAEVAADDEYEHGWKVRWWAPFHNGDDLPVKPFIHLVEGWCQPEAAGGVEVGSDAYSLGHFCVKLDPHQIRRTADRRGWLQRDSGSGRIWVGFANIRVEVRP
jgi:hypothetical protein